MGKYFGISHENVSYNLRKYGYVFKKKTLLYSEKNEIKRKEYQQIIKSIATQYIVCIDENGIT